MIRHAFSVLCGKSSIDSETNTVSILEVLEQLTIFTDIPDHINLPIQFELFSLWTRENKDLPEQGQMRIHFCDPSNICKNQTESLVDLTTAIFYRTRIKVNGLELVGPGMYKYIIELRQNNKEEWETVAQLPLLVEYQSRESGLELTKK